ncbi:lytic transglycosylase domain-containing protein [Nocardioides caeni]|uniref:Lytic transglycosylase domain-containing protein n=1 Tax=Nocardioides caeni TaxID=574700 RepID=A0A4S8MZR5_9ACTN|nr:lytic transglycosylase domain-containing protein [Nocardioides caeni]THV08987.1 lytic transglycosylase domain-containing protein [Nocardioides caeni]
MVARLRSLVVAAVAVTLVSGCAASTEAPPAADPVPAGEPAASPTATVRQEAVSRAGARADVPEIEIMAQLARRAERIAKNLPEVVVPDDVSPGSNQALGYRLMVEFGFPSSQWPFLNALWHRESGWNHFADNPTSSAYGIPQSLPGDKMAVVGADWRTTPETQIKWGLAYIGARYGTPQKAWQHSEQHNWY